MKLGDIYRHKNKNSIIQIDSFATPMGQFVDNNSWEVNTISHILGNLKDEKVW